MVQRGRLKEVRLTLRTVDVDSVAHEVMDLEEHQFVDELPMPAKSPIGRGSEESGLLVCEVGLRVDEPD